MPKVVAINLYEDEVAGDRVVPRVSRLNSIADVKAEVARLYKRSMRGEIPPADARHLGTLLNLLLSAVRAGEVEARILALEAKVAEARAKASTGGLPRLVRPAPVA